MQRLVLKLVFGLGGSACGSCSSTGDGRYEGVPTGVPSHTHGLSFTRRPQLMSMSSPRTYLHEVVLAASGPGRWGRPGGG